MKLKSLLFLMLLALLYSPQAFSQDEIVAIVEEEGDEEKTFTLSGSVDAYFHKSFGSGTFEQPASSFANLNGFGLGMANLVASYDGEKAGFVADLAFGPRGYDAVFINAYTGQDDGVGQRIVNQLYAYVKLGSAVTLNIGQFNTFLGYEVISPAVNVNYSTSYLFSYGPFNHTGLRADFDFGSGWGAKLAIMNATDHVEFNDTDTYTIGGQLGYTTDAGGIWLNVLSGDQSGVDGADNTFQVDLTAGFDLSESFYLGLNATQQKTGDGSFSGVALYPKLTLSEVFALGARVEYTMHKAGYLSGVISEDANEEGNVLGITLSGNYSVGNLMIIPEFRIDKMSDDFWYDVDSAESTDMLSTFTLAAVYKF